MRIAWRIPAWSVILVALMVTSATAASGDNDANSGADAGNARETATAVALGTTHQAYLTKGDIDWFVGDVGGTAAGCVSLRGLSNMPSYFALAAETTSGTITAPLRSTNEVEFTGGVAGMTPMTTTLRARGIDDTKQGHYNFRLDRVGVPNGSGDGPSGVDAGARPEDAMPVQPGCIGGHLAILPTPDARDVFRVNVGPDEVVTYSLAANVDGVTLALVSAADTLVGPVLDPGEVAAVAVPSGSYFLSAQRSNAVGDVGYIAGVMVGPDPTGCRPYCLA